MTKYLVISRNKLIYKRLDMSFSTSVQKHSFSIENTVVLNK